MRYNFSSIKTSHVYKSIQPYYDMIFKGMRKKKGKTNMKMLALVGDFFAPTVFTAFRKVTSLSTFCIKIGFEFREGQGY